MLRIVRSDFATHSSTPDVDSISPSRLPRLPIRTNRGFHLHYGCLRNRTECCWSIPTIAKYLGRLVDIWSATTPAFLRIIQSIGKLSFSKRFVCIFCFRDLIRSYSACKLIIRYQRRSVLPILNLYADRSAHIRMAWKVCDSRNQGQLCRPSAASLQKRMGNVGNAGGYKALLTR